MSDTATVQPPVTETNRVSLTARVSKEAQERLREIDRCLGLERKARDEGNARIKALVGERAEVERVLNALKPKVRGTKEAK